MADSKITGLAALTTADPANDMLPIVDVSDNSMAASGTTKRISINNILACSPSATLASATITGDLTVDTSTLKVDSANNRVGILTASPAQALDVASGNLQVRTGGTVFSDTFSNYGAALQINAAGGLPLRLQIGGTTAYEITSANVHQWSNVGGVAGTAMTLNSTGLGVGGSPLGRLTIASGNTATASWGIASIYSTDAMAVDKGGSLVLGGSFTGSTATYFAQIAGRKENSTDADVAGYLAFSTRPTGGLTTERMRIDSSGNVGIGVTPSAWVSTSKAIDIAAWAGVGYIASSAATVITNNTYKDAASNWVFKNASTAAGYFEIAQNLYRWWQAPAAGGAGTTAAMVQAMTLTAAGDLLVGTTSGSGSSSNSTLLLLGGSKTASGSVSATTAVATTIFSITAALRGRYEVMAMIPNSGDAAQYTAIATVIWDGSTGRAVSNNGSKMTITLSGSDVQITQSAGSTQSVNWSFHRFSL